MSHNTVPVSQKHSSSVWRQKGLTGYCFKYTDRPFCLQTDELPTNEEELYESQADVVLWHHMTSNPVHCCITNKSTVYEKSLVIFVPWII